MVLGRLAVFALLVWTFIYTSSYGIWTWKKKNRLGSVMIFMVAVAAVALPIYMIYFRE